MMKTIGSFLNRNRDVFKISMLIAILVISFIAFTGQKNEMNELRKHTERLSLLTEALCEPQRDTHGDVECKPIEKILNNQDRNLRLSVKEINLIGCLLVAHDVTLPVDGNTRRECAREVQSAFDSPTPNDSSLSQNNDSNKEPENKNRNGGGNENPPDDDLPIVPEFVENGLNVLPFVEGL